MVLNSRPGEVLAETDAVSHASEARSADFSISNSSINRTFSRNDSFFPATGSEWEWNAAYYRLEDYLRALHVVNKVHQSQVILDLLQAAAARHQTNQEQNPTTLALTEYRNASEKWFEHILGRRDHFPAAALFPLFLADALEQWPNSFFSENVAPEFQRAVADNDHYATPDMQVTRMVPRPLDVNPLAQVIFQEGSEKWETGTAIMAVFAVCAVIALVFVLIA